MRWVQVSGKISFVGSIGQRLSFELSENGHSVSVRVLHATSAENLLVPGMRVQVNGVCEGVFNSEGQRVVGIVWAATLKAVARLEAPAARTPSPANSTDASTGRHDAMPFATIDQIRQLGSDKLSQKPKVRLRGVVTDLYGTYIEDETGGIELVFRPEQANLTPALGEYVIIEGVADWVEGDMALRVESVKSLGKGSLPPAKPSSWS